MRRNPNRLDTLVGIAVFAGLASGGLSVLVAVFAVVSADWTGAGICLGAAALAFGLTANALLRQ